MRSVGALAMALSLIAGCAITSQSSTDSDLTDQVRSALQAQHLDGVQVRVSNGEVTLTGVVGNDADRDLAQRETERVTGVRGVANRIEVRPSQ